MEKEIELQKRKEELQEEREFHKWLFGVMLIIYLWVVYATYFHYTELKPIICPLLIYAAICLFQMAKELWFNQKKEGEKNEER